MRTKQADVLYCGCRAKKISSANPVLSKAALSYLYNFINRRYTIHLLKDVYGQKAPWTDDLVLQEYRFTNVRREHDRETKWAIEHIVNNKELTYDNKLLNLILFRMYNKHETLELLKLPKNFPSTWNPESYRHRLEDIHIADPSYVFFTGAFNTGGLKAKCKIYMPGSVNDSIPLRILYFLKHMHSSGVIKQIKAATKQSDVTNTLMSYDGLGEFLSYQIFVDFTYIKEFPFSENEFTIAGPGCKLGLSYLFKDYDGMTPEECLFWLRDHIDELFRAHIDYQWDPKKLFTDLPEEDRCLNVMSLENCFCELSKYIRAYQGTGRPRKKYKGGTK